MTPHLCEQQLPTVFSKYHLVLPTIFPPPLKPKDNFTNRIIFVLTLNFRMKDVIETSFHQCFVNRKLREKFGRETKVSCTDCVNNCKILLHPYSIKSLQKPFPVNSICFNKECPIKYEPQFHICGCEVFCTMSKKIESIEACRRIIEIGNLFIWIGI